MPVNYGALRANFVDTQIRPADVTNYQLIEAFLEVPREFYVPQNAQSIAYSESELSLNDERKIMSARSFSRLAEAMNLQKTDEVLIVGAGLGYEAAIIARLVSIVIALEEDELGALLTEVLKRTENDNVVVMTNPLNEGCGETGPYDKIFINGAVEEVPQALFEQLKDGGRLFSFVREDNVVSARSFLRLGKQVSSQILFYASAPSLPHFKSVSSFAF